MASFDPRSLSLEQQLARELHVQNDSKIVMLVVDGVGGLPDPSTGQTELETAHTPNLDRLAGAGVLGRVQHVRAGVTPGSGPGHFALFGYDPLRFPIRRGLLEASGSGFAIAPGDVLVRGNFCLLDHDGTVTHRKGRGVETDEMVRLVRRLRQIEPSDRDVQVVIEPLKDHRFLLVLRGSGLGAAVSDTDPQRAGERPRAAVATDADDPSSQRTAALLQEFVRETRRLLAGSPTANGVLLRGVSQSCHSLPAFRELYGLRAGALASYPMYRGVAHLVGMDVIGDPQSLEQEIELLHKHWESYDFFFVHFKQPDREGEFGRFESKMKAIELLDRQIPAVTELKPTVLAVTGDHSTPAVLRRHSWHPVPLVLAAETCLPDRCTSFGEREAILGGLGQVQAAELMLLLLAHADRLSKYD